ncbi:cell division FtsZ family protein [Luteolibacter sp. GHJ8]|uniref:Cell division protein FtsZ n=1 Tax=Luteolibacter rhizosphaerae TaxID=2989719 RepID=A0ABT3G697_9BACT|nr:cell division protein FtsZ [Luteolibacter rhizosphaerae]MCW1915182.1 cell division FtsZ family protein [Luteolibacter rhizosphaerae]
MIEFPRDLQNTIPSSSVKIVGLGGAGTNMLDRVVLDGMDGAEMLAINTDIRTLSGSVARDRIQLGRNLTKGLGAGGDPELGQQAVLEAESEVRASLKGRKIVFLCVGLGGGTGSGAAPIVCRIAREEGAFVVVFATMPFSFEGRRRREQADTSLNELAVLSNALVTFDNTRMGDLVLAKQGIHEAFAAADRMISESIKAVIRLVIRPGLINVGLDDLMAALRTTRSRCLFGSGIATGKDRAQKALRNALNSPLLDQGALLRDTETVLVHLCGGEDLTLYEIELLMQSLSKHVPEKAHVLFGAAVDPSMGDHLSITMISSLPEDRLHIPRTSPIERPGLLEPTVGFADDVEEEEEEPVAIKPVAREKKPAVKAAVTAASLFADPAPAPVVAEFTSRAAVVVDEAPFAEPEPSPFTIDPIKPEEEEDEEVFTSLRKEEPELEVEPEREPEPELESEPEAVSLPEIEDEDFPELEAPPVSEPEEEEPAFFSIADDQEAANEKEPEGEKPVVLPGVFDDLEEEFADLEEPVVLEKPSGKPKSGKAQTELSFEGGPRGKFEGASPSLFEGEDLDVPAFLRKKR